MMSRTKPRKRASAATPATTRPDNAPEARSWDAVISLLVIAVTTALVYSNTFNASFHFDDIHNIVQNERLGDLSSYWPPLGNRSLGYLSFALNYRIGGLEVFGYHVANLIIHTCNGFLVLWVTAITLQTPALRRAEASPPLRRWLPLAAGLLFAVHPVQTQGVTYIVQRFASLATFFFLLAVALYAQARLSLDADHPSKTRAVWLYMFSVLAAVGAMKTKEISATLPFVVAGYGMLFFDRRRLLLLAPFVATALLVPIGLAAGGHTVGDVLSDMSYFAAETREIPRWIYLLTQSRVVVTYLRLLLLPIGQNLDYDFRLSYSLSDPSVLFALAVLLAAAVSAVVVLVRARKTNRAPGVLVFFGFAWFFVTLSVESSVIPIRDVIFEHRMYLPSAGAAIAFGTALLLLVERIRWSASPALKVVVALLVTAGPLSVAAHARNRVWKDEVTLWTDVVAKSPTKGRPLANLAVAYTDRGRVDEAIALLYRAIALEPGLAKSHNNLGAAFKAKGQLDDAAREYREAIRLAPRLAEAHTNLGVILLTQGRAADAVEEIRHALDLTPRAEIVFNLGLALEAAGRGAEALVYYQRFLDEAGQKFPDRAAKVRRNIAQLRARLEPTVH